MIEDEILKRVGYEKLNQIEVLAIQGTPTNRIAEATGLSLETLEHILCGPDEEGE